MKITLEEAALTEPEVIIRGHISGKQVQNLIELLNGNRHFQKMFFFKNGQEYLFDLSDVVYFEAANNKTFAVIDSETYEVRHKLYELESIAGSRGFVRISKGVVVNVNYAASVAAEFSGNYTLSLKGSETRLTISRKYVKQFRDYIIKMF